MPNKNRLKKHSKKKFVSLSLSAVSRQNMLLYPAKVERHAEDQYSIYCFNGSARSYLYNSMGFPVYFKSVEAAEQFIQTF